MEQKLVVLLLRRFAVVAGDRNLHIGGNNLPLQELHPLDQVFGHPGGVGPFAFGHGEGDGRIALGPVSGKPLVVRRRPQTEENIVFRLLGTIHHRGHVGEVDGAAVMGAHHEPPGFVGTGNEAAGLHQKLPVPGGEGAGRQACVPPLDRPHHLEGREPVGGQPCRIETHRKLAAEPTHNPGLGDVVPLLQLFAELAPQFPERLAVVAGGPEGQGQDRHIIDGLWHHQRLTGPRREDGPLFHHLVVELDEGLFHILANKETDRHQPHPRLAHGVDILHPRQLPHGLLEGDHHPLLHLLGGGAGKREVDVDHRHDDLGLLLPRGHQHRIDPKQKRRQNQKRCQLRVDERFSYFSGNAEFFHLIHPIPYQETTIRDAPPELCRQAAARPQGSRGT